MDETPPIPAPAPAASTAATGEDTSIPPRSPSPESVLDEYVALKCKENLSSADFPQDIMKSLAQLPLFQAIQAVHRFNDSVGPRVVNRQAFLISIIRTTNRWWSPIDGSKIYMDGPNTALIVKLCMTPNSALNPDVFTPSVCHVLQLLSDPEEIIQVAQDFSTHALAQAFSNDSYYAKQQLFLSMAQACLKKQDSVNRAMARDSDLLASELSASKAAEQGRRRADLSAQFQLTGILSEFIARTCATSRGLLRESDIDNTARDALKRVALLQAMQAVQHFSSSLLTCKIVNRSAYLMGIIGGQEQHWEHSRAATKIGGAQELLNLHPRLLLKIAHLCLDGNCLPSDFSPEVCLELKQCADFDTALRAVMSFNNNKRIIATNQGGIRDRVGFFHGLIRNINLQHPAHAMAVVAPVRELAAPIKSASPELNPRAKPYSPLRHPAAAPLPVGPTAPPVASTPPPAATSLPKQSMDDTRLLESSREAIAFLTSNFARSRTSEIRLRRELAESQAQVHLLMQQMQKLREDTLRNIENARAQVLVSVSHNFDALMQGAVEHAKPPASPVAPSQKQPSNSPENK